MKTTTATTQNSVISAIESARHEAAVAIRENPTAKREIERRLAKQIRALEHIRVA